MVGYRRKSYLQSPDVDELLCNGVKELFESINSCVHPNWESPCCAKRPAPAVVWPVTIIIRVLLTISPWRLGWWFVWWFSWRFGWRWLGSPRWFSRRWHGSSFWFIMVVVPVIAVCRTVM